MTEVTVENCCALLSPCDALCMLRNVQLDLITGKKVRNYEIGAEKYTLYQPTMTEVRELIRDYEHRCELSKGKSSRRRASVRFRFGRADYNDRCR